MRIILIWCPHTTQWVYLDAVRLLIRPNKMIQKYGIERHLKLFPNINN